MLSPINESGSVDSSRNTNQSKFVSNDVNKDTSSDAISVDGNKRSVIINEAQPL